MSYCALTNDLTLSCDAKPVLMTDRIRFIDFDDFLEAQSITEDSTSGISAITLKAGTRAYKWNIAKGSSQITPSAAFKANDGIDTYTHSVGIRVTGVTQLIANEVAKLNRKVVAVLEFADGTGIMLGRENGLAQSEFTFDLESATAGTIMVTVATRDSDPGESLPYAAFADTFDFTSLDTEAV